jgi:predicted permease
VRSLLVADSLTVALSGGLAGLFIAPLVANVLLSFLPSNLAGVELTGRFDTRVFAFALAISLFTGALCASGLAWQVGRTSLVVSLRERSGQSGGARLRKALVVGQMAFTLILLVGAGLFVQTLVGLYAKGPGFSSATHLLTFGINVMNKGLTGEEQERMSRQILTTLRALPDVENAGISGLKLLDGGSWNQHLTVEADTRITTDRVVHLSPITPGLFATLGTRVVAGRDFDDRDARPLSEAGLRSVIVNERFARRYFGDRSPIGRRIGLGANADTKTIIEIVGVVQDFSYRNLREADEQAFFPLFEGPLRGGGWFYLKVRGRPEQAIASVRAAVSKIDPTLPLLDLRSFEEQMDRTLTNERMLATLSAGFGVLAMLLAAIGLFGVMSFVVTSRTGEIGVRLALGATRGSAVWRVVSDAGVMVGVGVAIALPCVWGLRRFVEAQLFGIDAIDARTIVGASAVLALAALTGALAPAWRAASVKPTEALRAE